MKHIIFILVALVLLACKKNEPNKSATDSNIKEDVEISLAFSLYSCKCNGIGLPTVNVIDDNSTYIYIPDDIPQEIKNQIDWQNKEYIATLKIKDETCECEIGVDPFPGNSAPTEDLKKTEIIKIEKK